MQTKVLEAEIADIELVIDNFIKSFSYKQQYRYINEVKNFYVVIFEKFSFRTASDLSGIIIFDKLDNKRCKIAITASGAKQGFFRFSYGDEKKIIKRVYNFLIDQPNLVIINE